MEEQEIEALKQKCDKMERTKDVYQKLYLTLFNAVSDALGLLSCDWGPLLARAKLAQAQQRAEEYYIDHIGELEDHFFS